MEKNLERHTFQVIKEELWLREISGEMIVKLKRTEGGWREGRLQATQTPEKEAAGGRKGHKLQRIPLFPKTSVLLTGGETLGCFFLLFLSFSLY